MPLDGVSNYDQEIERQAHPENFEEGSNLPIEEKTEVLREKFVQQFGEDPEDVFGPDWIKYVDF